MTVSSKDKPIRKIPLTKLFPNGFDKTNPEDMMKLTVLIQEKAAKDHSFDGYSVLNVDKNNRYAIIAPMSTFGKSGLEVDARAILNKEIKSIRLNVSECVDSAQKKTVANLESQPQNEGWSVIDFMRVTASECVVLLQQLDEKTLSSRRIFANVLGVQPWNIRLDRTQENGWRIRIKEGTVTYQASRFDTKMQEAVETVGKKGWFFKADPETGVIMVYPGTPPTFPKIVSCPKQLIGKNDLRHAYLGMKLPDRGRETGDWLALDWKSGPGIMVAAAANSGKSVVINTLIGAALEAGFDLAVCDDEDKSVDFQWCRPWVIDHGWGCDGIESSAATLAHILEICSYRSKLIKKYGVENWWGLPDDEKEKNPLLLLVCDEVAQWAGNVNIPKVQKDNPMRIRAEYEASIHAANITYSMKITQKARFSGICFLFCGQSVRLQDGFDPGLRVNLTTVISPTLQPSTAVEDLLGGAKDIPEIPENIMQPGISRGAGLIRLPGMKPVIYKGFYDEKPGQSYSDLLCERLTKIRPPKGNMNSGHWGWGDIVNTVPAAAEKPDDGSMYTDDDTDNGFPTDGFGEDGRDVADRDKPLRGAAAAAHASKLYAAGVDVPHMSGADAALRIARDLSAKDM
ncbi:cell division protein FtsK [Bifidobacterium sp. SO1]|uniref:cell division protein FtsK n=1 Tax=Bifidobacterium sp. SO1 TaxID=2809029 RepID=UPI001BDD0D2D|nr:cell division protein FtsK [Bifidobacterium sp. SO1]MBT1162760.1 cell division protein FtsK [Bifidobacterium sp. SO1]